MDVRLLAHTSVQQSPPSEASVEVGTWVVPRSRCADPTLCKSPRVCGFVAHPSKRPSSPAARGPVPLELWSLLRTADTPPVLDLTCSARPDSGPVGSPSLRSGAFVPLGRGWGLPHFKELFMVLVWGSPRLGLGTSAYRALRGVGFLPGRDVRCRRLFRPVVMSHDSCVCDRSVGGRAVVMRRVCPFTSWSRSGSHQRVRLTLSFCDPSRVF